MQKDRRYETVVICKVEGVKMKKKVKMKKDREYVKEYCVQIWSVTDDWSKLANEYKMWDNYYLQGWRSDEKKVQVEKEYKICSRMLCEKLKWGGWLVRACRKIEDYETVVICKVEEEGMRKK